MFRWANVVILLVALPLLTGFIFSKSKVDIVQGFWKSEKPDGGLFRFVEIGKDYITIEGKREEGMLLEEKEGVVIVRKAGIEQGSARILIHDDDHITFEIWGMPLKLVRSSAGEMRDELSPPVKKIVGLYRNSDGKIVVRITEGLVSINNEPVAGKLVSGDRKYVVERGNRQVLTLSPRGDGSLVYSENVLSSIVLTPIGEDEARQLADQRAEAKSAAKTMLKNARGLWAIKTSDRYGRWHVMEISEDSLSRKGKTTPIISDVIGGTPVLCLAAQPDRPILTLVSLSDDGKQLMVKESGGGFMAFSNDEAYERVTRDEIRLRNEPQLSDLNGYWVLEDRAAPTYHLLAFQNGYLMRNRHVEPVEGVVDNCIVRMMRPGTKNQYEMMRVSRSSNDRIDVRFGRYESDGWFSFRRLSDNEARPVYDKTPDTVAKLAGYWKSAEPVREGRYGYIGIKLNQTVKNMLADVFEFLDTGDYTKNTTQRTGFLGYAFGNTNKPAYRLNDDGRPSSDSFLLIDDNRMVYTENGKKPINFVRVSEEEARSLSENRDKAL